MVSFFRNIKNRFSKRQIVLFLVVIFSLLAFVVLTIWMTGKINGLTDQQAAARWDSEGDSAQVSCFFADNVEMDEFKIKSFEQQLEKMISVIITSDTDTQNADKRTLIDSYCSTGKITVTSEKGKIEADAVGIGGDFFMFHPLELISGEYFSGNELMKDSIILDEDAAWQLFGSTDIAGMSVMIGGVPHFISGVIRRQDGKMAEAAGLGKIIVYLSYESLSQYGTGAKINTYEIVAPDPVQNFVFNAVKEKLGVAETDMLVVENSSRYSIEKMIPVILDFGSRSMQNKAVQFPYWENIARGWEDIRALILLFQFLFLLIPFIIVIIFLIYKWKHKSFTAQDIKNKLINVKDEFVRRMLEKKKSKMLEGKDE